MRSIIIATGGNENIAELTAMRADSLVWLLDRPFLQHLVEGLVGQGITEFDFFLSHRPETIEMLLGDGIRWGVTFRYHLIRDPAQQYDRLASLLHNNKKTSGHIDSPVLLAHADWLVQTQPSHKW